MTSNMDEFENDQFDPSEPTYEQGTSSGEQKKGLVEAWRNKPIFKLLVIMIGVGAALAIVLGTVTPDKKPIESEIGKAPPLNEAPGGTSSPFFIDQNKKANLERVDSAMAAGGSVMPTPVGNSVEELVDKNKKDPLVEFRETTERLKQERQLEQQQNAQQMQAMQQQLAMQNAAQQRPQAADDTLARAMQKQMEALMESWNPRTGKFVKGYASEETTRKETALLAQQQIVAQQEAAVKEAAVENDKTIIPSGTVNYVQLLTEANSDIPGPILAQILSGPLSGGRAIGRFSVMNDYLVMNFTNVSYKGKEYTINALALDPDTTLGGMATEVDHRYFSRVLLPAAGAFVSAFGNALSEGDTTTTISDGAVLQDKAKKGGKEALYSGLGQAGQTVSQFFQNEANNIKTLVRVAVGTPMGLFFTQPVMSSGKGTAKTAKSPFDDMSSNTTKASVPYPQKTREAVIPGMSESQAALYQNMMELQRQSGAIGTTYPRQ